ANLGASATEMVVKKGHLFIVGDFIGNGTKASTITAIEENDTNTDKITIDAALGAQSSGTVLTVSSEAGDNKALRAASVLNYADVKLEGQPSVSGIYAADEVRESRLPYPV